MDFWSKDEDWAMPIDAPAYPPPPWDCHNSIFQGVFFTTDPQNIAPLLPKPLQPSFSGRCCAFAIDSKSCTVFGPYREIGIAAGCFLNGQEAFFLTSLFINNSDTMVHGREVTGSPKMFANINIKQEGNEITSTAIRADIPIIQINSKITSSANPEEIPRLSPMYKLKIIPSADGQKPAVKQLILSAPSEKVQVHKLFKGPGIVNFTPTVAGEFWRLQPDRFEGAIYQESSFQQGYSKVVIDYLA